VPKKFIRSQTSVHVRRRDLLRFVDFRRLAVGQYISQTSDAATSVLIAQFVLFESATGPTATLLIQSVLTAAIPLLLAGPISGVIADKFSRRIILWYGQFLRAFLITCMLVSGYYGNKGVVLVLFACCMCLTRISFAPSCSLSKRLNPRAIKKTDSLLAEAVCFIRRLGCEICGCKFPVR
jgi:MFS family permease